MSQSSRAIRCSISEGDATSQDFGKGLTLVIGKRKISFKYQSEPDPAVHLPPFCGAQASMERVEFSLQDRQPLGA